MVETDVRSRDFFSGGGEMGALMRAYDWSASPLGAPDGWPQSLRTALRLLLTTQHPMFIWWGPDLIQFYNDAYRRTMGPERHPSAIGQRGRECWEEIWEIIGPQIDLVMQERGATWHEDQLVPVTRHGRREDVWWTYSFGPIDDAQAPNGVGGVLVVCNDVTDRHRSFDALSRSEERLKLALSAGVIGSWDWDIAAGKLVVDEHLAGIYGVDAEKASRGAAVEEFLRVIHPEDKDAVWQAVQSAIAIGGEFAREYRVLRADGSVRWILARGRGFPDATGTPMRFTGAAIDITDRKLAEHHRNLLAEELAHRVKNMLAMVLAIANQTLRDGVSIADAKRTFAARLQALARAQDVLTGKGGVGAELHEVIRTAIEPHSGGTEQFRLTGPDIVMAPRPALSFALTLHELATNAAKYGALTSPKGQVDINWRIDRAQLGDVLQLRWEERGGPPVMPPQHKGFGSRLIEGMMAGEPGVTATIRFEEPGLIWSLTAPLQAISEQMAR